MGRHGITWSFVGVKEFRPQSREKRSETAARANVCRIWRRSRAKFPVIIPGVCRSGRDEKRGKCQTACKPGSVRALTGARRPFLWDAPRDAPRATNPGGRAGSPCISRLAASQPAAPIRSCSRWGLPCRPRCRGRGALLPHPFTLAREEDPCAGGLLSVALSLGSPPPAVGRHRLPVEPGLSSNARRRASAAVQPSGETGDRVRAGVGQDRGSERVSPARPPAAWDSLSPLRPRTGTCCGRHAREADVMTRFRNDRPSHRLPDRHIQGCTGLTARGPAPVTSQ